MNPLKKKYFLRHLYASLIVVSTLSFICQYFWFPAPFLMLDGTWFAIIILAATDIIIGPFLTLLLAHSKKSTRELRLDLAIILSIQLTALGFGLNQIYQERVFAMVYANSLFHPIPTKEVSVFQRESTLSLPKYNNVYYAMLDDTIERPDIIERPRLYSPEVYTALSTIILQDENVTYDSLPEKIRKKYDETYHYKILAGKKRVAFVILNNKMEIIGLELSDIALKDEQYQ